ncbi:sialate O-acetylesterase [Sphingomonas suaedae]|uniref:Sialate O-acetylesterase n=1 Tax=Sphingomonas suaedae TaxID=2599297 RepID=A0A518RGN9_9SPHN|nr:sialate O-acetylesterase [Sphingomonas suaedae]QDX26628.1 sialate O-acetylesterase [Sphingomonas suaedae]
MRGVAALLAAAAFVPLPAAAQIAFAPAIGDQGVLQRDKPIVIEGEAAPGTSLTVTLSDTIAQAKADESGQWRAILPAMKAGGPYRLRAATGGEAVEANGVMVGDVWLCSGQSNMEFPVRRALDFDNQMNSAADPMLRLLTVPKATSTRPLRKFGEPAAWQASTRETAPEFSAACWYMARALRKAAPDVAVGLIDASWGGTAIRAWLDPVATRRIYGPEDAVLLETYDRDPLAANTAFAPRWIDWWRTQGSVEPWRTPDAVKWSPVPGVGPWDSLGEAPLQGFTGWVWFRRSVTLTPEQARGGATLSLGIIDDGDQAFVNGKPVGNSFGWSNPRDYIVPGSYWKAGANEVVVAVWNSYGTGGFMGPAERLKLTLSDGSSIPLGDQWHYWISAAKGAPPRPPWDTIAGLGLIGNAMVAPLGGIGLRGVAWYQGESDSGQTGYDVRLRGLIDGYRRQFSDPALQVLVVGLAGYGAPAPMPVESGWAKLRDEQRRAVAATPGTALVSAIDLGSRTDIHPGDKNELGKRLARAALGKPGPQAVSARRDGSDVVVSFNGVEGALAGWSGAPIGFELCAQSCRFARATAEGTTVRVLGDGQPVTRIRYGWADTPVVNLYDAANMTPTSFELAVE